VRRLRPRRAAPSAKSARSRPPRRATPLRPSRLARPTRRSTASPWPSDAGPWSHA
jgi:hypothetical protein